MGEIHFLNTLGGISHLTAIDESVADSGGSADGVIIWDNSASEFKYMTLDNLQDEIDTSGSAGFAVSDITNATELASGLASTDELVLSDGGVLKRMDVSVIQAYMQSSLSFTANTNTNQLTTFQLEDGDGTEVTVSHSKEVKLIGGTGITTNWTDTSTGSDGDPYDMTIALDITNSTDADSVLTIDGDGTLTAEADLQFNTTNGLVIKTNRGIRLNNPDDDRNSRIYNSGSSSYSNIDFWTGNNTTPRKVMSIDHLGKLSLGHDGTNKTFVFPADNTGASAGDVLAFPSSGYELEWVANPDTNTNTTYSLGTSDGDNTDEEKITLTNSSGGSNIVVLEAGTGLSIARSSNKITFTNTVSDTNTQNTYTSSFVDSTDDIILRLTKGGAGSGTQDVKFVAGSNVTLTHTDANNITIASTDTNTNTTYSAGTLLDLSGTTFNVDLGEATEAAVAVADDYILFLDGSSTGATKKESIADLATAMAGSNVTATNGVFSVAANTNTTYSAGTGLALSSTTFNLDVDGLTDIGASIQDADLLIIDDGAGGTTRKTTMGRVKTWIGDNVSEVRLRDARDEGPSTSTEMRPTDFSDKSAVFTFTDDIASSTNSWDSVLTMKGWSDNYRAWQIFSASDHSTNSVDTEPLYFRSGEADVGTALTSDDGGWGVRREILTFPGTTPNADGSANQVLVTNGSGALTWANQAGASGEANQNAFSNVAVSGQTTVAADSTTDTLTFVAGSNVSITTNATNDSVTINATDTNTNTQLSDAEVISALNSDLGGDIHFGTQTDDNVDFGGSISLGNIGQAGTYDLTIGGLIPSVLLKSTDASLAAGDTIGSYLFFNNDYSSGHTGRRVAGGVRWTASDGYGRGNLELTSGNSNPMAGYGQAESTADTSIVRLKINSDTGHVFLPIDAQRLYFGAGSDMFITHSGTEGLIQNDTGLLNLDGQTGIYADVNGSNIFRIMSDHVGSWRDMRMWSQTKVRFYDADTSNYVALRAPDTVSSDVTWKLPAADGSAGQVLTTDASGNLSFTSKTTNTDTNTQLSQEQVEDYVAGVVTAGSNVSVTYDDTAGTLTIASTDTNTNTQLSTEQVQDIVGAMFSSNTETRISATYQDADGTIDLVVDDLDTDTTYSAGTGLNLSTTTFSVDVSDFMSNGVNNRVVTATGTDAMNAESGLTFSSGRLSIIPGNNQFGLITGSDVTASSISDNTRKFSRVGMPHYKSAEEPVILLVGDSDSSGNNKVKLGGGTNQGNAATIVEIMVAGDQTTVTGTTVADFTVNGLQLGGSGARVTTVLDQDNMSSNSNTALATQQSIKAYVDANAGGGGGSSTDSFLIFGEESDDYLSSTSGAGNANGFSFSYGNGAQNTTKSSSGVDFGIPVGCDCTLKALYVHCGNKHSSTGSSNLSIDIFKNGSGENDPMTGNASGSSGNAFIISKTNYDIDFSAGDTFNVRVESPSGYNTSTKVGPARFSAYFERQ